MHKLAQTLFVLFLVCTACKSTRADGTEKDPSEVESLPTNQTPATLDAQTRKVPASFDEIVFSQGFSQSSLDGTNLPWTVKITPTGTWATTLGYGEYKKEWSEHSRLTSTNRIVDSLSRHGLFGIRQSVSLGMDIADYPSSVGICVMNEGKRISIRVGSLASIKNRHPESLELAIRVLEVWCEFVKEAELPPEAESANTHLEKNIQYYRELLDRAKSEVIK